MRGARPLAALALLATVAAALAGCAPDRLAGWAPDAWPASPVVVVDPPAPLDPAAAGGHAPDLDEQRIRNDAVGVQARFALLPGGAPLDTALEGAVRDATSARAAAAGVAYSPQVFAAGAGMGDRGCVVGSTVADAAAVVADPAQGPAGGTGTAVACDVVAATGTLFAERLRTVTATGGVVSADSARVYYTDTSTGQVAAGDGLWNGDAAAALWRDVVDTVRRDAGSLSLSTIAPPDAASAAMLAAALAATTVTDDGMLVITLPAGFTAPELRDAGVAAAAAPLSVGVPRAVSAPLLTAFGADVVALAAAGADYAGPARVAAGFEPVDCHLVPCVALTYDDGPSDFTAGILDALQAHHAAATFFAMGEKAAPYAQVMRRAVDEGHLVENHTWNHPHLPTLSAAAVATQLRDTTAAIEAVTGQPIIAFRPPYGEYTPAVLHIAGLPAILWDVDTLDWQHPDDAVLIQRAVDEPRPGSIVLQHDIQPGTARTVDAVYSGLADRGFVLVNLRQLFGGAVPTSGAWRSAR